MKNVSAVIGSNFGDEGKGHMVDYLSASQPRDALVVRFNGGAQAGHTVVAPDGRRHVFHHFGSGTMNGAKTYLGPKFISNPMIFAEEYPKVAKLAHPVVYVHPDSPVSTPYDAMLNQSLELARDKARHGSCGIGIWETVLRNEEMPFTVKDLFDSNKSVLDKVDWIRSVYAPLRCKALGLVIPNLNHEAIFTHFIDDLAFFVEHSIVAEWAPEFLQPWSHIIFEGAQGLRLDQDSRYTPYVSGSKTGLANVRELMLDGGLKNEILNVFYVTRPYITRHGAGPLPHETPGPPYPAIVDKTNLYNEWQGDLRFGLFDMDEFVEFVAKDVDGYQEGLWVAAQLAVTCLDHIGSSGQLRWINFGKQQEGRWESFMRELLEHSHLADAYVSTGATHRDVRRWP